MSLDKYGYFPEDGREFVITRPDTPAPWVNYISNARYTGLVTNTGRRVQFLHLPQGLTYHSPTIQPTPMRSPGQVRVSARC